MTTLSLAQLQQTASRQTRALTTDEKIVFSYLEAKVHYGVTSLTAEAFSSYEESVNRIGTQVPIVERKPL